MARSPYTYGDYCALCGVRLVHSDDGQPLLEPLPWDRKVRALCFTTTQAQPFLTGLGYLRGRNSRGRLVVADVDASVPYTNTAASLTTHRLGPDYNTFANAVRFVFGLHDACWTLLMLRIRSIVPSQDAARDDIAVHLYHVLFCLPRDRQRRLGPAQDYGGRWRVQLPHQNKRNWDYAEEEWSFLLADPLRASAGHAPPQTWPVEQALIRGPNCSGDVFSRLPRELIVAVLMVLPSADLCSLRLASRVVSCVSSPTNLPMSFWYSRFGPGFEMAFYLGGRLPQLASKDWSVLYGQIRYGLARPSAYPGLHNRRRIWHILGDLTITLKALLQGSPARQASTSHATLLAVRHGVAAVVPRALVENPACQSTKFDFAWDVEEAFLPMSTDISSPIKISSSFIRFDGRSYICGIRATASTPAVTLSQVGLIRPTTEQHLYLDRGQKITKVQVACSLAGVFGARFFIQTTENAGLGSWHSVGMTGKLQYGEAIAELLPSRKILGLTLEFDACKCISIRLLEPCDEGETEPRTPSPLWSPGIPRDFQFSNQAVDQSSCEESKFCLNMDFGGPQGERLSLLNRITPFLDDHGLLRGMAFFYDDGTELVFGSHQTLRLAVCIAPSIGIRGSAGERIIRVYCETDANALLNKRYYLQALDERHHFKVETNMGIKSTFAILPCGKSSSGALLTAGSQGRIITGLVAQVTKFEGSVERLEARYINGELKVAPGEHPHAVAISREHLDASECHPQFNHESSLSGALLGQVRSIHFSTGDDGHCRSRDSICGMLVRFWDIDQPLILGQWIREIEGTCVELQQGEQIVEIAVWYTPIGFGLAPKFRDNHGTVAGIRLVSSKGQVQEIRLSESSALLFVQCQGNLSEIITGLVWTVNRQWDFIQVLRRPQLEHTGTILVPLGLK